MLWHKRGGWLAKLQNTAPGPSAAMIGLGFAKFILRASSPATPHLRQKCRLGKARTTDIYKTAGSSTMTILKSWGGRPSGGCLLGACMPGRLRFLSTSQIRRARGALAGQCFPRLSVLQKLREFGRCRPESCRRMSPAFICTNRWVSEKWAVVSGSAKWVIVGETGCCSNGEAGRRGIS